MSDYNSHTEKDLLLRVAEGDENAFRLLFTQWSSKLYHFIYQLSGSKETAEDILQDSFLKIWLRRDRLDSIDNFSAYLFRMAKNAVADSVRRRALEAALPKRILSDGYASDDPDAGLHIKLVKNVLEQAVRNLPEQQQKVWRLRREYGKRIREISDELGISENTVKRHLGLATDNLREELRREFPLEGGILLVLLGFGG